MVPVAGAGAVVSSLSLEESSVVVLKNIKKLIKEAMASKPERVLILLAIEIVMDIKTV